METMCERKHIVLQDAEAVQMLRDFCLSPDQHMLHPKRFSNSIIMSIGKLTLCVKWTGESSEVILSSSVRYPYSDIQYTSHEKPV